MSNEPVTCPRCGEERQIEKMQKDWRFCVVCACPFKWPRPAAEIRGEAAIIQAVPNPLSDDESGGTPTPHHEAFINGKKIDFT